MRITKRLELEYRYENGDAVAAILAAHEAKFGPAPEGYVWECSGFYSGCTVEAVEPSKAVEPPAPPTAEPNDCKA